MKSPLLFKAACIHNFPTMLFDRLVTAMILAGRRWPDYSQGRKQKKRLAVIQVY
jgi:hypothetical protein